MKATKSGDSKAPLLGAAGLFCPWKRWGKSLISKRSGEETLQNCRAGKGMLIQEAMSHCWNILGEERKLIKKECGPHSPLKQEPLPQLLGRLQGHMKLRID